MPTPRPTTDPCDLCGWKPGTIISKLAPPDTTPNSWPIRFWDSEKGWRVGVLCSWCSDAVNGLLPHPSDLAVQNHPDLFAVAEDADYNRETAAELEAEEQEEPIEIMLDARGYEQAEALCCPDRIDQGKCKKPFEYRGQLFVCYASYYCGEDRSGDYLEFCRVVPANLFPGPHRTYAQNLQLVYDKKLHRSQLKRHLGLLHRGKLYVVVHCRALVVRRDPQGALEQQSFETDLFGEPLNEPPTS